jgi:hypothetical protein
MSFLKKECRNPIIDYPEKLYLFENYMKQQLNKYKFLKSTIGCSTFVIKRIEI